MKVLITSIICSAIVISTCIADTDNSPNKKTSLITVSDNGAIGHDILDFCVR